MLRSLREIQLLDACRLERDLSCMHDPPSQLNVYLSYLTRKEMGIKAYIDSDLRFLIGWSLESDRALYGPPLPLASAPAELLEQMKHCYRVMQAGPNRDPCSNGLYVFLLNKEWADSLEAIGARVFPTPDDDNYVYRSGDIGTVQGSRLKPQRQNVRYFSRNFGDLEERELDAGRVRDAEAVIRKWAQHKISQLRGQREGGPGFYRNLRDDYHSALESLRAFPNVPVRGKVYYLSGEPIGYVSGLHLAGDTFLLLNQKSLRLRGLSETVLHRFARSVMDQYAFLNGGSDAGIASLRFQKEHWGPWRILKTYGAFLPRKLLVSRRRIDEHVGSPPAQH